MSKKLQGKRAVVTGGSRGIGAAIAKRLAEDGADVVITYAGNHDAAKASVAAIEALGVKGRAIQADAADAAAVTEALGGEDADGVIAGTLAAVPYLANGGRVLIVGSVMGETAMMPGAAAYSASKFAVQGLARGWARDLAPRGVLVNVIQPGPIDTDMNPADGALAAQLKTIVPLGRYGRAEEVAALASFLASEDASYITGTTINIDGGALA